MTALRVAGGSSLRQARGELGQRGGDQPMLVGQRRAARLGALGGAAERHARRDGDSGLGPERCRVGHGSRDATNDCPVRQIWPRLSSVLGHSAPPGGEKRGSRSPSPLQSRADLLLLGPDWHGSGRPLGDVLEFPALRYLLALAASASVQRRTDPRLSELDLVFNSIEFAIFFVTVVGLFFLIPERWR